MVTTKRQFNDPAGRDRKTDRLKDRMDNTYSHDIL